MIKKVIYTIFFLFLFFPFICQAVNLNEIPYEKINPSNSYSYKIKRLKEKMSLTLFYRTPSKKANFLKTLLSRRKTELKYIVDNKDIANIQNASQRYSTTAGQITEVVIKNNLTSEGEYFQKLFTEQITFIEKLQTTYKYDSAEWLFLKWDIDYLKIYLNKLSN